jgi:hypothetical protein
MLAPQARRVIRMVDTASRSSLVQRMIRAARLETDLYEEVEADRTATNSALTVVVIVAVANGIGQALAATMNPEAGGSAIGNLIGAIIGGLIGWVIWSYITWFIGTRLFGGRATPGELMRTIGFAQSPGVLSILSFIPGLGWLISLVIGIWMLVTGVVAVRQALDFDTGKAVLTTIIGWVVGVLIPALFLALIVGAIVALVGGGS